MFLEDIERGLYVHRAHTVSLIHEETVGHHSAHVAAIIIWIMHPVTPSGSLLRAAILHDVAEGYTGDIPANVKIDHPNLRTLLHRIETDWWEERGWTDPSLRLDSDEALLLKIADYLSLGRMCAHERLMGNRLINNMQNNIREYLMKLVGNGAAIDSRYRDRVLELVGDI